MGAGSFSARSVARALTPIDGAWLYVFRVFYGLVLGISMLRFLAYGWIERLFLQPFQFKYYGFEWVMPLAREQMHTLFVVMLGLALAMTVGLAFRVAASLFAIGLAYVQLIDVTTYLNHYYLAALLAGLLAVSPAGKRWSLDALIRAKFRAFQGRPSALPGAQVSSVWLWLFRFQIAVVYTFAGLAKLQPDWLLHAQPLRIWLAASTSLPVIGKLFTWPGVALSWCGFLFDSTIVWFLLHRRTRVPAYLVVIVFHVFTRVLFPIGMFPAIMVLSALVFFSPSWPRHAVSVMRSAWDRAERAFGAAGKIPSVLRHEITGSHGQPSASLSTVGVMPRVGLGLAAAYCAFQLLFPLRFLVYGGNVLWHEQGMRFSWRVMVRAKGGATTFIVRDERNGHVYHVNPHTYLTGMQESEMSSQPDLILQLAHHIAKDFARRGIHPVSVRADTHVSLNGRRSTAMIDPNVDLLKERDGFGLAHFVTPAPPVRPPHTRTVF